MLTPNKAVDAVRFVYEALDNPEQATAREDMGELHAALVPHLHNWSKDREALTRPIEMVSAVGSVNYDLVVETSDLDMKAVYMPSFEDLYFNKFPKFRFVTDEFDCELHPAQHFCQHVLKGNINFFEFLYSKACIATPDFNYVMKKFLKPMVEMNVSMTALASFFTAKQQEKGTGFGYHTPPNWGHKKASHALRILAFLIHLLDSGEIDIVPREPLRGAMLRLKRDEMGLKEYRELYNELYEAAKNMMFKSFKSGSEYEFTDRVLELDRRGTPEWDELQNNLDNELMRQIKEPIEQAYHNKFLEAGVSL